MRQILNFLLLPFYIVMRVFTRRKKRIYWRQKVYNVLGKGGIVMDETGCEIVIPGVKVYVVGTGNRIIIDKNINISKKGIISISIFGNNNTLRLQKIDVLKQLSIGFGDSSIPIDNATMEIGAGTSLWQLSMQTYNSNSAIKIGRDCMLSTGINIYHSDGHPVYDIQTGKILNKVGRLTIGDHVWIARDVLILKNVEIPDDCIVARNAVVTKKFDTPHCVIAGNPATIKKTGITWKVYDPAYHANKSEV